MDKEGFKALAESVKERLENNISVQGMGEHGTDIDLEGFSEEGFLPTKNWTTGWFPEGAKNITGTTMSETILIEKRYLLCLCCKMQKSGRSTWKSGTTIWRTRI